MEKLFKIYALIIFLTSSLASARPVVFYLDIFAGEKDSSEIIQGDNFVYVNGHGVPFYTYINNNNNSNPRYTRSKGIIDSQHLRAGINKITFEYVVLNNGICQQYRETRLEIAVEEVNGVTNIVRLATLKIPLGKKSAKLETTLDLPLEKISPAAAHEIKVNTELANKIKEESEKEQANLLATLHKAFGKDFAQTVCFTEGTKIKALDAQGKIAYRNLEDIKVGEQVMTCNFEQKACQLRPVKSTLKRDVKKILRISTENETLEVTPEHPFYTPDHGWVEARRLKVSDKLHSRLDDVVKVSHIEELSGEFWVYNIEVDAPEYAHQNYFVSESDILVHNCHLLEGAAIVAPAAMLLGGGTGAGVIIALNTGIAIAKVASGEDLQEVAKDFAFEVTTQICLGKLGVNQKLISTAEGAALEFAKLAKNHRDKILQSTLSNRKTAKHVNALIPEGRLKQYLKNVESVPKEQLFKDIESLGWKNTGTDGWKNGFAAFKDKNGVIRARIDGPHSKTTPYPHLHIYDRDGNSLNALLEKVSKTSKEAHIPINPK